MFSHVWLGTCIHIYIYTCRDIPVWCNGQTQKKQGQLLTTCRCGKDFKLVWVPWSTWMVVESEIEFVDDILGWPGLFFVQQGKSGGLSQEASPLGSGLSSAAALLIWFSWHGLDQHKHFPCNGFRHLKSYSWFGTWKNITPTVSRFWAINL